MSNDGDQHFTIKKNPYFIVFLLFNNKCRYLNIDKLKVFLAVKNPLNL